MIEDSESVASKTMRRKRREIPFRRKMRACVARWQRKRKRIQAARLMLVGGGLRGYTFTGTPVDRLQDGA